MSDVEHSGCRKFSEKNIRSIIKRFGSAILVSLLISMVTFWGVAQDWSGGRICVEDFIGGSDYEILRVDAHAVERAKHGMVVTIVPYAYVSPGGHKLTVALHRQPEPRDIIELDFVFERGKRYRIATESGEPKMVVGFD